MNVVKRGPKKELKNLIKYYWILDIASDEIFEQRIIPFGNVDLIIHLKNPLNKWDKNGKEFHEPQIFIEGQYLHSKYVSTNEEALLIGVSFYPWATKSFYNLFAIEFSNRIISYDLIDPDNYRNLYNSLDPSYNYDILFETVEKFFLNKKKDSLHASEQEIQDFLINCTELSWGKWSTLYKNWGSSMRSRETIFKNLIGINSKKLFSKLKFQYSIRLLESARYNNLTSVALDAGYYDQSDFCRHFKRFSGITPKEYVNERNTCFGQLIL